MLAFAETVNVLCFAVARCEVAVRVLLSYLREPFNCLMVTVCVDCKPITPGVRAYWSVAKLSF